MVELRLTESKAALLTEILEGSLADLRAAIAGTDTDDDREGLERRARFIEETLRQLTALPVPIHM